MKSILIALVFVSQFCRAQEWQAEIMTGIASYNGDLTQSAFSVKAMRPTVSANLKYEFYYLVLRAGIAWGRLAGSDKYNKDAALRNRGLDFRTNIWEASLCAELNLVEPDIFYAYPYLFAGVGLFHFDPYSFDKDNKKTHLRPLSTEGQGLPEYPQRKKYSLTQFCLPIGAGWKLRISERWDLIYEFGYRAVFTDYLDDVSTNYVSNAVLTSRVGPKAAEMAVRTLPGSSFIPKEGDVRGNPRIKDSYFFSGIKLLVHLTKE